MKEAGDATVIQGEVATESNRAGTTLEDAPAAPRPAEIRSTHPHSRTSQLRRGHWIFPHALHTVRSLLMILVAALFALTFILQPFRIPSESMERTLLVGDFLLVNKSMLAPAGVWSWLMPYRAPHRGDIIVFHFPLDPADHVVKRVIAVPADTVRLHDGRAVVNGEPLTEPYAVFESSHPDGYRDEFPAVYPSDPAVDVPWALEMRRAVHDGSLLVPEDSYFALGDNRNHSRDSRYWGYVPGENIVGTPFLIYFSVRQPSATDTAPATDDRLGKSVIDRLLDFARWDRVLHIVR